jgi:hypothetical protein
MSYPLIHLISIPNTQQARYAAHVLVAYILTAYVIWLLRREMLRFLHLRHQFLISKSHSKLAQAKTVLITSLPEKDLITEADLRTFASFVPGGVAKVWVYRDAPGLNGYYQQRLDACDKLEGAISQLLRDATKTWAKKQKREKAAHKPVEKLAQMQDAEHGRGNASGNLNGAAPNTVDVQGTGNVTTRPVNGEANSGHVDVEARKSSSPLSILDSVSRPSHRLRFHGIPWVGVKVDTIEWAKKEIPRLNDEIARARMELPNAKPHGAAMIMCNLQMGAHVLAQCTSYHEVCVHFWWRFHGHYRTCDWDGNYSLLRWWINGSSCLRKMLSGITSMFVSSTKIAPPSLTTVTHLPY